MKESIGIKKLVFLCCAVLALVLALPHIVRAVDLGDEENVLFVADVTSINPPAPRAGVQAPAPGGPPSPAAPGYRPGYGRWGATAWQLNLTEDQITKMRNIWSRYYLETRDLRFDIAQRWLELHRLFTDPKTNTSVLMGKEKELISLRERLMMKRAQAKVECRSVLTPEQIQRLDIMVMSHFGMGGGRMGGGMMGPGMMGGTQ